MKTQRHGAMGRLVRKQILIISANGVVMRMTSGGVFYVVSLAAEVGELRVS